MARTDGLVVARTSYATSTIFVHAGEVWVEDDPVVKNYPAAFKPLVVKSSLPERASTAGAEPDDKPARPRSGGRFARKT